MHRTLPAGSTDNQELRLALAPTALDRVFHKRTVISRLSFALGGLGLPAGVSRGVWDLQSYPFVEHPTYRLMKVCHDSGFSAREVMPHYVDYIRCCGQKRTKAAIEAKARANLDSVLRTYEAIAQSMSRDGYVPDAAGDDIGLAIGRDGSPIKFSGGNHRLALALILGLDKVVASVRVVHRRWHRGIAQEVKGDVLTVIRQGLMLQGHEFWRN